MLNDIKLHYVCHRCGRKLSKVDVYTFARFNVRRECGGCGRQYSLTITPHAIKQGWAHVAVITELEARITDV